MTAHILDRPVWHALATRQAHIAQGSARARRFAPDIGPFAATADDSIESLAELATLLPAEGAVILLQKGEIPVPPGAAVAMSALGVQMVARTLAPLAPTPPLERLTDADAPAMLELATLTAPGPFLPRTNTLGQFWGVKENGKLIAMAGERMKLDGYTEVSGVCTHPGARGRGLAGLLSRTVATQILNRGETPMLHAFASNTTAVALYEKLGFELRCHVNVMVLTRG
jgi:predicted GNAT family acetyltransferase